MLSETINSKVKSQSSKMLAEKGRKDLKKEVPVNRKDANIGLRIPGSNWQTFKNLVTETAAKEPNSNDVQVKKKKLQKNKLNHKPTDINSSEQNSNGIHNIKKTRNRKPTQKYNNSATVNTGMTQQATKLESKSETKIETKTETKENEKKTEPETGLTRVIAMDCEMVGIGDGQDSMIARVSIVNRHGICVYDKYVKPTEEVRDYRTAVSGIRPQHLQNGHDFKLVQKEVSEILKGRILVGHALHNDLAVLFLSHPKRYQRDTSRYKLFRKVTKGNTPSLKKLASELLDVDIQCGEHSSIEDARAAMQLYQLFRKKWENDIRSKR